MHIKQLLFKRKQIENFRSLQIKENLICVSKGITGGFLPMGATVCKGKIYQAFHSEDKHKALLHGHSYSANPLACASALASLDLLQAPFCRRQREMIANSHANFVKQWKSHPKLKRCASLGTILAMEYRDKNGTYFSPLNDLLYHFFFRKNPSKTPWKCPLCAPSLLYL